MMLLLSAVTVMVMVDIGGASDGRGGVTGDGGDEEGL